MTAPRCTELDDVRFLLATPSVFSATEAARVHPYHPGRPAHDAFSRLLERAEPDSAALWAEVKPLVRRRAGVRVVDDTTLDKPYARHIEPVTSHGSGEHHAVVRGIRLVTLLWTDGDRGHPCDYRLYDTSDGKTQNDPFADRLAAAEARGSRPEYMAFDGWYASLANLKALRGRGWRFLTRLRSNRRVSPVPCRTVPLSAAAITAAGTVIHLPGFGSVKVFRLVATNGDAANWCTDDLGRDELGRLRVAGLSWTSRRTTWGSSRTRAWSAAGRARPTRSGSTSAAPCGRSCGWRTGSSGTASPGSSPSWKSPLTPSVSPSPGHCTKYH